MKQKQRKQRDGGYAWEAEGRKQRDGYAWEAEGRKQREAEGRWLEAGSRGITL